MGSIRIYELAKRLGMDSKKLVSDLKSRGIEVKGPLSTIDEDIEAIKGIKSGINDAPDTDDKGKKGDTQGERFISTEEIRERSDNSSKKERDKLSIFYRSPESPGVEDTPATPHPKDHPEETTKRLEDENRRDILSITFSIIGITFSLAAIIIAITFASKTRPLPQSVNSILRSHEDTTNRVRIIREELARIRSQLQEDKRLRLERELYVIEHLSKKVSGKTKGELERLADDMSLLLREMNSYSE